MTLDCLKESGVGKEVKRVSKSSSSNSGEQDFPDSLTSARAPLPPSLFAKIHCSLSESPNRVEKLEFPSAMLLQRQRIKKSNWGRPYPPHTAIRDMASNIASKWRALLTGQQAPASTKSGEGKSCQFVLSISIDNKLKY